MAPIQFRFFMEIAQAENPLSFAFSRIWLPGVASNTIRFPRFLIPSISSKIRISCPPHPLDDSVCNIPIPSIINMETP